MNENVTEVKYDSIVEELKGMGFEHDHVVSIFNNQPIDVIKAKIAYIKNLSDRGMISDGDGSKKMSRNYMDSRNPESEIPLSEFIVKKRMNVQMVDRHIKLCRRLDAGEGLTKQDTIGLIRPDLIGLNQHTDGLYYIKKETTEAEEREEDYSI